jgi:hypothetical protein
VTPEKLAADPDAFRPQWVDPATFWPSLETAIAMSPKVGPTDQPMADQARTLLALRASNADYEALLDEVALEADTELHAAAKYAHVGVDAGNGWQRQENAGDWGTDWFGRALASVIYIMVNDYREAIYFIRATDADGRALPASTNTGSRSRRALCLPSTKNAAGSGRSPCTPTSNS